MALGSLENPTDGMDPVGSLWGCLDHIFLLEKTLSFGNMLKRGAIFDDFAVLYVMLETFIKTKSRSKLMFCIFLLDFCWYCITSSCAFSDGFINIITYVTHHNLEPAGKLRYHP